MLFRSFVLLLISSRFSPKLSTLKKKYKATSHRLRYIHLTTPPCHSSQLRKGHIPLRPITTSKVRSQTLSSLAPCSSPRLLCNKDILRKTLQQHHNKLNMTSMLPSPPQGARLPRNDSFSTEDITRAFQESASKPRNHLSLRIVHHDETSPPPPSPLESRPVSSFGFPERRR